MANNPLERLEKLAEVANAGLASVQEVGEAIGQVLVFVRDAMTELLNQITELSKKVTENKKDADDRLRAVEEDLVRERSNIKEMVETRINSIEVPPGEPGKDADVEEVKRLVLEEIKIPEPEPGSPDTPDQIRNKLESIEEEEEKLSISAIGGLEKKLKELFSIRENRGIFGIPSRGMFLSIGGVKKGIISNLNIVGGSGVSVSYSKVNGQDTITIDASGGGVTVETPHETPNAVITVFTVSAEPQWMVADGITYYAGKGYTYSTGQVKFEIAPSQFVRAIL